MYDHTQACPYCDKFKVERQRRTQDDGHYYYINKTYGCTIYEDTSWVNRMGGCPFFPMRDMTGAPSLRKERAGQQKQKHQDRTYHSKNDGKRKYKFKV